MSNGLTVADLEMFGRLGILPDLLGRAGVSRVTDAEARCDYGITAGGDMAGIIFPYCDPLTGDRVSARLRRNRPDLDPDATPKGKYVCPWGDNRHLYFLPGAGQLLGDVSVDVIFVEAEKSALALAALSQRSARKWLVIATGGCWGWHGKTGVEPGSNGEREQARGPLLDMDRIRWRGRKASIIFDSNVTSNPQVAAAREAVAKELYRRGAKVFFVDLPRETLMNGPDDFIAARGDESLVRLIDAAEEYYPTINLKPGERPQAVDEAEKILLAHAERLRIFQRGGEIVRVVTLPKAHRGGGLDRQPGTIQLAPVRAIALTETWDRLITWRRARAGKDPVRIDCPDKAATTYLSRTGLWRLPVVTGIVSAPIARPDGTVLHRSGYDPESGLFLTEDWPELCDGPTRDDALSALRVLDEPFSEFPFVSGADRTVFRSAVLTAIQRRVLQSAPLHGFTGPAQRTGKSLLAESVAIIATGRPAPAMACAGNREEIRKAVAAVLREGHLVINLDNIEQPLASPDLSRAITQPEYADRVLGETRVLSWPTNLLWTATGNNLTFCGDLAVRVVLCRLDAGVERPEERNFQIVDLKQYVTEHRRSLVAAAITILRAYYLAGRPDQRLTPWGGFDEWSRTIRAALVWLGLPDPCGTRQYVIEDDPDREAAAAVFAVWHATVGSEPVGVAAVVDRSESSADLRSALLSVSAANGQPHHVDSRRLSWWCRKWCGLVVNGLRLDRGKDYGTLRRGLLSASVPIIPSVPILRAQTIRSPQGFKARVHIHGRKITAMTAEPTNMTSGLRPTVSGLLTTWRFCERFANP